MIVTPEERGYVDELAFDLVDSYDTKDWNRLHSVLTSTLLVDYSAVLGTKPADISASDFVARINSPSLLGNPVVVTQHLLGASKYKKTSETEIMGSYQVRAAHQRFTDSDKTAVEAVAHGYGLMNFFFKYDGQRWLITGVKPSSYWMEGDLQKIFVER